MATQAESQAFSDELFELLHTPGQEKVALDAINDFTRDIMREESFLRVIVPSIPIDNSQLDRQTDTDKPVKVVDKEARSPAALSMPFAAQPPAIYIKAPRYRVLFDRIVTNRFVKDANELLTWHMDIRQVVSDNAIKDMLAEEDSRFMSTTNTILIGQDVVSPVSGVKQWRSIHGGIKRDTWEEALKTLPSTPSRFHANTLLINNVTIYDVCKWGRDEIGGDWAQEVLRNGWSEKEFNGARLIISIKDNLVPDSNLFMWPHPKFIGKNYLLEDTTLFAKREYYIVEFFAYQSGGGAYGNWNAAGRATFV